ncbi:fibronectin type III domain-containing protein [Thermodesulfobacteriota bacterium]
MEEITVTSLVDPDNPEWTLTTLTPPVPTPVYYFVITAVDEGGFESNRSIELDTAAPQVTSAPTVVSLSDESATITWATDKPGDSIVEYGTNSDLTGAIDTPPTANYVTNHNVTINGLAASTTYYLRVKSTNAQDIGPDYTNNDNNPSPREAPYPSFTTASSGAGDTTPPVILTGPAAIDKTGTTATIVWTTDDASSSVVEYGKTTSYALGSVSVPGDVTSHSVGLSGLDPQNLPAFDGTYHFRVRSTNAVGLETVTSDRTFKTLDTNSPVITGTPTHASVTATSAIITWKTDEPATSVVEFGETTSYSRSKNLSGYVTDHSVTLTNLGDINNGTSAFPVQAEGDFDANGNGEFDLTIIYHYRVGSSDAASPPNGPTYSGDFFFTTASAPDNVAPAFDTYPSIASRTNSTATVVWDTDEASNSVVKYWYEGGAFKYASSGDMVTHHSIVLNSLGDIDVEPYGDFPGPGDYDANGNSTYDLTIAYNVIVSSTDAANNSSGESDQISFTTTSAPDVLPPVIKIPPIDTGTSYDTSTIVWQTDELSDSLVEYGFSSGNYTLTAPNATMATSHSVTLTNLGDINMGTAAFPVPAEGDYDANGNGVFDQTITYYYRVGSTDASNNGPAYSTEKSFTTNTTPDYIPPVITAQPTVSATNTSATIRWTTDEPSNSQVQYRRDDQTGSYVWGSYPSFKNNDSMVTQHVVTLTGLLENRSYYFRVGSSDASGNGPASLAGDNNPSPPDWNTPNEKSFITPDETPPVITSQPIDYAKTEDSATIRWETNENSNSVVYYKIATNPGLPPDQTGELPPATYPTDNSVTLSDNVTVHLVALTNLQAPDSYYWYKVFSIDPAGNQVASNDFYFKTDAAPDIFPPVILDYPTAITETHDDTKDSSATVTWQTDEPSTSTVDYYYIDQDDVTHSDSRSNDTFDTTHQVTLTNLVPDTTYYFRVSSMDQSGNGPDTICPPGDTPCDDESNPSPYFVLKTDPLPDREPPNIVILDPQVDPDDVPSELEHLFHVIGNDYALIKWETDELSNSVVEYYQQGTSDVFNQDYSQNVIVHQAMITNLLSGTAYSFRVASVDSIGNGPTYSNWYTFTTTTVIDDVPPVITWGPAVFEITDHSAVIRWTTNEPSNSTVEYGFSGDPDFQPDAPPYLYSVSKYEYTTNHEVTVQNLYSSVAGNFYNYRVGSVDVKGNGPTYSNNWSFYTEEDVTPPMIESATFDPVANTIDIKFNEPHMRNATDENNYTLQVVLGPGNFLPLLFLTSDSRYDDIVFLGNKTYRLYMYDIPKYAIILISNTGTITDEVGFNIDPTTLPFRINDNDQDDMADDWEETYNLNTSVNDANDDADGDGYKNVDEYRYRTNPRSASSFPSVYIRIKEAIPHDGAGIDPDSTLIPDNTSFAVRIEASTGINIRENSSISFGIDDDGDDVIDYSRNLGSATVETIKLADESDTFVTNLWVAYHRVLDTPSIYAAGTTVNITVYAEDIYGLSLDQTLSLKIEAQPPATLPTIEYLYRGDPDDEYLFYGFDLIYDEGIRITTGNLAGTIIIYDSSDPILPEFGPVDVFEPFSFPGASAVGFPISLRPPTIFTTPVLVLIPCPDGMNVNELSLFRHNGSEWLWAADQNNNIKEGGVGWIVPPTIDSENIIRDNQEGYLGVKVYHFTLIIAGTTRSSNVTGEAGGGGGCFIATAAFGSEMEEHVRILSQFRDKRLLTNRTGKKFVKMYYEHSPAAAAYLCKHDNLRGLVRYTLIPITGAAWLMLYIHPVLLLLFFIGTVSGFVYYRKKPKN